MGKNFPRKKFLKLAGILAFSPLMIGRALPNSFSGMKRINAGLEKLQVIIPCGNQVPKDACILLKNQKAIIVVRRVIDGNQVKLQAVKFMYVHSDEDHVYVDVPIEDSLIIQPIHSIKIMYYLYGMELKNHFRRPTHV